MSEGKYVCMDLSGGGLRSLLLNAHCHGCVRCGQQRNLLPPIGCDGCVTSPAHARENARPFVRAEALIRRPYKQADAKKLASSRFLCQAMGRMQDTWTQGQKQWMIVRTRKTQGKRMRGRWMVAFLLCMRPAVTAHQVRRPMVEATPLLTAG